MRTTDAAFWVRFFVVNQRIPSIEIVMVCLRNVFALCGFVLDRNKLTPSVSFEIQK